MNLRAMFQPRQLLSAATAIFVAITVSHAPFAAAQAPAGADVVVMKPPVAGQPGRTLQGVLITGVQGTRVTVKEGAGEIGYELSQIERVTKAAPAEFVRAGQAIEAGNSEAAIALLKPIVDRFKGLPTSWAQESMAMLGNLYVGTGKLVEAEMVIKDFERAYGGANSPAARIGKARLAAASKRFSEARTIASEIVSGALAKKNVSRAESQLYGQAYFILGQCDESENKLADAMENYCRTVAIFYQEPTIVKEAQLRIDELRKKNITTP